TLLRIAQRVGSTITELAYGNCLYNADLVYVGQQLRVPRLPVTPPPQQVTLHIITPVENATIDLNQPIIVTGAGTGLGGNNIVVRALDGSGNLLGQQTVIGGNALVNGENQWQVNLNVQVASGTKGAIYAFAQSPASGQILADALVDVTFGTAVVVTPVPGTKQLIITQPTSDMSVTPSGQLQVNGQVLGPIEGDVFVRILDNQGNVLGEEQAQVSQPDAQGNATWQAMLTINVPPGTRGTIFAYIPSPFDVAAMIADSINVVFGQADNGPYVTITNPIPYSTIDTTSAISIAGRGGALFEGNVVVRALDNLGNVLAETSTIINSPNAGTGGEGNWQANLQINVAKGTRGSIVALSTSAQDGSIVAFASVYVTYGDPSDTDNFVKINAPLPGTVVDPSQTLMIAGTADRRNGNTVKVQIVDDQGHVLVEQPRNLNPAEQGDFGVWQMLIELKSMPAGTHLRINALTTSHFDGTTLATDSVDIIVGAASQGAGGS
ncbi:MAG: Gmad2 immunoglobulin-like domain-containing protein, partial [Chloroflexota bacterium]